jgi:hypothetical protein
MKYQMQLLKLLIVFEAKHKLQNVWSIMCGAEAGAEFSSLQFHIQVGWSERGEALHQSETTSVFSERRRSDKEHNFFC